MSARDHLLIRSFVCVNSSLGKPGLYTKINKTAGGGGGCGGGGGGDRVCCHSFFFSIIYLFSKTF